MLASLPSQQPNSDLASSSAALTTSPKGEPPPKSLSLRAKSQQTSPPLAFRVKRGKGTHCDGTTMAAEIWAKATAKWTTWVGSLPLSESVKATLGTTEALVGLTVVLALASMALTSRLALRAHKRRQRKAAAGKVLKDSVG